MKGKKWHTATRMESTRRTHQATRKHTHIGCQRGSLGTLAAHASPEYESTPFVYGNVITLQKHKDKVVFISARCMQWFAQSAVVITHTTRQLTCPTLSSSDTAVPAGRCTSSICSSEIVASLMSNISATVTGSCTISFQNNGTKLRFMKFLERSA